MSLQNAIHTNGPYFKMMGELVVLWVKLQTDQVYYFGKRRELLSM